LQVRYPNALPNTPTERGSYCPGWIGRAEQQAFRESHPLPDFLPFHYRTWEDYPVQREGESLPAFKQRHAEYVQNDPLAPLSNPLLAGAGQSFFAPVRASTAPSQFFGARPLLSGNQASSAFTPTHPPPADPSPHPQIPSGSDPETEDLLFRRARDTEPELDQEPEAPPGSDPLTEGARFHMSPLNDPLSASQIELPGHLTEIQCAYFRVQEHCRSYRKVCEQFWYRVGHDPDDKFLSIDALRTCLRRTALGQPWFPGYPGGADWYLCQDDTDEFKRILQEKAAEMDSVITVNAIALARQLRQDRQDRAIALLDSVGATGLVEELLKQSIAEPDRSWLNHVGTRLGISIKNPESIEDARRRGCNKPVIEDFFRRFQHLIDRPPELILNCDETHVSSRKHYKVVVPAGVAPLKRKSEKLPHFSAMCTISASGYAFRPTFIVPTLHSLPRDLRDLRFRAYFVSTSTGWMTQVSFLFYGHFLIEELALYRQSLPPKLRSQRLLLILDGHISRFTYDALFLLSQSGVDVLVFPAHCTHLLQPFDVCIASPVKDFLAKFLEVVVLTRTQLAELERSGPEPDWVSSKRRSLLIAFLKAWDIASRKDNVVSAFETTGIYPFDPAQPLKSKYAGPRYPDSLYPVNPRDPSQMNSTLVTSPATLGFLKAQPNRIIDSLPDGRDLGPVEQYIRLLACDDPDGRFLSAPTTHFGDITPERYQLVHPDRARRCLAYNGAGGRPAFVWTLINQLGIRLPILIICRDGREANVFHNFFLSNEVLHIFFCAASNGQPRVNELQHAVIADARGMPADGPVRPRRGGSGRPRAPHERPGIPPSRTAWIEFQENRTGRQCELCVANAASVSSLQSVRTLQLVYTACPSIGVFWGTCMDMDNILIMDDLDKVEALSKDGAGKFDFIPANFVQP
jgi:hypothetical protein